MQDWFWQFYQSLFICWWYSSIFNGTNPIHISNTLQEEFDKICNWLQKNCLALNIKKTKCMTIGSKGRVKNSKLDLYHNRVSIKQVDSFKYLGVMIDSNLKWDTHVTMVRSKVARAIGRVHRLKHLLPKIILSLLYYSLVLPHLDFCNVILGRTTQTNLQKLQNRYIRMNDFKCWVFNTLQTNAANPSLAISYPAYPIPYGSHDL